MVVKAEKSDSAVLAELAVQLWDGHSKEDLENEFTLLTEKTDAACFIKYDGNQPVGFAQCQLRRDYVEGTSTSPVGYLEGIFVIEEYRHRGHARELLSSCEEWAKEMQCEEFTSDCGNNNDVSLHFHLAMGFEEVNRIICFKKELKSN